jgi:Uma2 family endonuclease
MDMVGTLIAPLEPKAIPPLENGDRLSAREFLRRYEAMPEVKKAELIQGIVYMGSPIRLTQHAEPDNLVQGWLFHYAAYTPGTKAGSSATARLGPDDVPQPDALLRVVPECGGRSSVDAKGYLQGPPELVVEIAASSASIDAGAKRQSYRRAGILEYLLWRTQDAAVDWWVLEEDEYRPLVPDAHGVIRSRVFPGLWLNVPALLSADGPALLAALEEGLKDLAHGEFAALLRPKSGKGSQS